MAYKILISEATHADVDRAIGYIAETLGSPGAAAALLDEYEYCLKLIRDNPYIFGLDLFVSEALNRQIRRCSVKRYSFYYLIDDQRQLISVVAFTHGLQDSVTLLGTRLSG